MAIQIVQFFLWSSLLFVCVAQTTPDSLPSHCDVLQSYHLSRTAAEVCSSPTEGVSLEFLVDIFFSPLNPFRITAFLLAQRWVLSPQYLIFQCDSNPFEHLCKVPFELIAA